MSDYIDRENAINAVIEQISDTIMPFLTQRGMMRAIKILENLPTAKPDTGAWVGIDDFPHEEWECNQCGKVVYTDCEIGIEDYEYCPHCGAEMLNAEGDGGAEWVEAWGGEHYKCSHCGFCAPYYLSVDREPCEWLSDFCPNCGKLMRRGGEKE